MVWSFLKRRKTQEASGADPSFVGGAQEASPSPLQDTPDVQEVPDESITAPTTFEEFYGLERLPFHTVPDPHFIYWSEGHRLAFAVLRYGVITRAPITLITGEIGAGKTTLLRQLLAEIPEDLTVGLISNMQAGRGELLHWVMMAFDLPFSDAESYVTLFRRFQDFVIEAYAAGQRVVLIVDEAQNLSPELLEDLRLLSNINADGNELLQLILVGQPNLRDLVNRPELVQFAQRVTADFNLTTLSEAETASYINTRLEKAGAGWEIFPPSVCETIFKATQGIPRLINVLCDLCLAYGFASERRIIDERILHEVLGDTQERGVFNQFTDDAAHSVPPVTTIGSVAELSTGTRPLFRVKNDDDGPATGTVSRRGT